MFIRPYYSVLRLKCQVSRHVKKQILLLWKITTRQANTPSWPLSAKISFFMRPIIHIIHSTLYSNFCFQRNSMHNKNSSLVGTTYTTIFCYYFFFRNSIRISNYCTRVRQYYVHKLSRVCYNYSIELWPKVSEHSFINMANQDVVRFNINFYFDCTAPIMHGPYLNYIIQPYAAAYTKHNWSGKYFR